MSHSDHGGDAFTGAADEMSAVSVQTVSAADGARVVMVSVSGEIDILTQTPLLQGIDQALDQPGVSAVAVDLSGVSFFSSTGIAALAHAHSRALEQNLSLRVVVPTGSATYRPLELTGMTELLAIYPTRAAAGVADRGEAGGSDPVTGDDDYPHGSEHHLTPAT